MQATFTDDFDDGFVLEDSNIRKVRDIILKRAPNVNVYIDVEKSDGVQYHTENFEEMFESENSSWTTTKSMKIFFESEDSSHGITELTIKFSRREDRYSFRSGLNIRIKGNNKDNVSLLGDDLVKYLSVSVIKKSQQVLRLGLTLALISIGMLFWSFTQGFLEPSFFSSPTKTQISEAASDSEKLDYIINVLNNNPNFTRIPMLYVLLATAIISPFIWFFVSGKASELYYQLFPKYVFVFGVEADNYNRSLALKKNITWSVLVSSIVAIATGLLVWYLTSR
ncbi:hypothetical protein YZOS03_13800 [Vibrio alginolyticus]|uniref:hypothetical protein n=1 Tax=Vibrio alginolyticus TaxID=663 RepID=UPI0020641601|nr:hypothetical protein [Vibrio alginolyticus]BCG12897.1 hypothetical protein YZOS03_13800 [Vibrio alginolyticus]